MRSYDRSYDPQVCNTCLSLLFLSQTHAHTYMKALLSLTWWRFPARVTCTRATVELFLYSNKHSLGMFTERSTTLTVQPQKTCTQVWCYLGSHKILGFRQKKRRRARQRTKHLPRERKQFSGLFEILMAKIQRSEPLQLTLSATLTQLPLIHPHCPSAYDCLPLRVASVCPFTGSFQVLMFTCSQWTWPIYEHLNHCKYDGVRTDKSGGGKCLYVMTCVFTR